jgi:hypothetical protein
MAVGRFKIPLGPKHTTHCDVWALTAVNPGARKVRKNSCMQGPTGRQGDIQSTVNQCDGTTTPTFCMDHERVNQARLDPNSIVAFP